MKKNKIIPLFGVVLFAVTAVSFTKMNQIAKLNGQDCDHVGYHYEMAMPSESCPGHYEFWVCCKCHEVFLEVPTVGSFVDNDPINMTGGIDETHPAYFTLENTVTVTFIDTDENSIFRYVSVGDDLTNIPNPTSKTGYNVSWDRTDFTNITENITVHAVSIAKTFTVNLNPNGGTISNSIITVTYDQPYSLEEPIHDEYMFDTWKYGEDSVSLSGVWNIDSNSDTIELIAYWGDTEWTDIY